MTDPKKPSQGLRYLKEVRPQAVEHLLQFFAESARHLDPKTRFLISVVTKVIAGSQRGMRQYVKRALEAGASPDEIIDSVLCAYPCAGLTKVVDAIDTILEMEIPGFSPDCLGLTEDTKENEAPPENGTWYSVGKVEEFSGPQGTRIDLQGRAIAVFQDAGKFYAIDDSCPHKGDSLAGGLAVQGEVACPLHDWRFRLEDGSCVNKARTRVRTFATRIVEGNLEINV